ncbi:MAG: rRNA maturation RNase YbeY [Muribaculaceae bacterium]|nr:rRNA maturation RNase YbeY [Muribaculaceae bacterium]
MSHRILWNVEGVEFPQVDTQLLEKWITLVANAHNRIVGNIVYIFCNDEYILQTNRQFLNHDYYTDIITFDYCKGRVISGDLVISLDTVRSNAEGLQCEYSRELLRVIIHGILHLCGIDDKGPGEREIMEAHENEALAQYDSLIRQIDL